MFTFTDNTTKHLQKQIKIVSTAMSSTLTKQLAITYETAKINKSGIAMYSRDDSLYFLINPKPTIEDAKQMANLPRTNRNPETPSMTNALIAFLTRISNAFLQAVQNE